MQVRAHRQNKRITGLTEVHVPQPWFGYLFTEKLIWRGFWRTVGKISRSAVESKYYGNWYGNRLTVTICVTTKTLLSPTVKKRRFV